jgi:hypothetical protein
LNIAAAFSVATLTADDYTLIDAHFGSVATFFQVQRAASLARPGNALVF